MTRCLNELLRDRYHFEIDAVEAGQHGMTAFDFLVVAVLERRA